MSNRRSLIAQIHIAKKDLGLDDGTYRHALKQATGKASCRDMGMMELHKAVQWFKDHGWKPKTNKRQYSPPSRQRAAGQKTQQDKLRALWISMAKQGVIRDGSEKALGQWVQRMTAKYNKGVGWQSVAFVPEVWLSPLIEDLKKWQQRRLES